MDLVRSWDLDGGSSGKSHKRVEDSQYLSLPGRKLTILSFPCYHSLHP